MYQFVSEADTKFSSNRVVIGWSRYVQRVALNIHFRNAYVHVPMVRNYLAPKTFLTCEMPGLCEA